MTYFPHHPPSTLTATTNCAKDLGRWNCWCVKIDSSSFVFLFLDFRHFPGRWSPTAANTSEVRELPAALRKRGNNLSTLQYRNKGMGKSEVICSFWKPWSKQFVQECVQTSRKEVRLFFITSMSFFLFQLSF